MMRTGISRTLRGAQRNEGCIMLREFTQCKSNKERLELITNAENYTASELNAICEILGLGETAAVSYTHLFQNIRQMVWDSAE